jgi:hypothetical protein
MPIEVEKMATNSGLDSTEQHRDRSTESEDIHIRNYDTNDPHRIKVALRDKNGQQVFENKYVVRPQGIKSVSDAFKPGTYVISVQCDDIHEEQLEIDIGTQPEKTAVIELGNGILSITQGLF